MWNAKLLIRKPEKTLEDNLDGEFCSRGYNTMKGYYKMPDATASTVDSEGWLHSGDLARRKPDGTRSEEHTSELQSRI